MGSDLIDNKLWGGVSDLIEMRIWVGVVTFIKIMLNCNIAFVIQCNYSWLVGLLVCITPHFSIFHIDLGVQGSVLGLIQGYDTHVGKLYILHKWTQIAGPIDVQFGRGVECVI